MIKFNPVISQRSYQQISFQKKEDKVLKYDSLADRYVDENDNEYIPLSSAVGTSIITCLIGVISGLGAGIAIANTDEKARDASFLQEVEQFVDNQNIDSFAVKDFNKDEVPDILLSDKNGSKFLLDINNRKIQRQEKGFVDIEI